MKSLARPSFFRLFELLLSRGNPGFKKAQWLYDGVSFERERHSFTSSKHGLVIEIVTLSSSTRRPWSLMVTKEHWWAGNEASAIRNTHWAKPLSGERSEMMSWLRKKEKEFDREIGLLPSLDDATITDDSDET